MIYITSFRMHDEFKARLINMASVEARWEILVVAGPIQEVDVPKRMRSLFVLKLYTKTSLTRPISIKELKILVINHLLVVLGFD